MRRKRCNVGKCSTQSGRHNATEDAMRFFSQCWERRSLRCVHSVLLDCSYWSGSEASAKRKIKQRAFFIPGRSHSETQVFLHEPMQRRCFCLICHQSSHPPHRQAEGTFLAGVAETAEGDSRDAGRIAAHAFGAVGSRSCCLWRNASSRGRRRFSKRRRICALVYSRRCSDLRSVLRLGWKLPRRDAERECPWWVEQDFLREK